MIALELSEKNFDGFTSFNLPSASPFGCTHFSTKNGPMSRSRVNIFGAWLADVQPNLVPISCYQDFLVASNLVRVSIGSSACNNIELVDFEQVRIYPSRVSVYRGDL